MWLEAIKEETEAVDTRMKAVSFIEGVIERLAERCLITSQRLIIRCWAIDSIAS